MQSFFVHQKSWLKVKINFINYFDKNLFFEKLSIKPQLDYYLKKKIVIKLEVTKDLMIFTHHSFLLRLCNF